MLLINLPALIPRTPAWRSQSSSRPWTGTLGRRQPARPRSSSGTCSDIGTSPPLRHGTSSSQRTVQDT